VTATPVDGVPAPLPAKPRPQAPRIEVVVSMRTVALGQHHDGDRREARLGGALLGVVGAIIAVPVAASVKIVVREVTAGRRARMAGLREAEAPEPA